MTPLPLPLSNRNDGCRVEAVLAYSSKGLAEGLGRVTMRGDGGPCKNEIDDGAVRRMFNDFLLSGMRAHYTAEISGGIGL